MTAVNFTATASPRDTAEHDFSEDVSVLRGVCVEGSPLTVVESDDRSVTFRGSVPEGEHTADAAAFANLLEDTLVSSHGIYFDLSVTFDPAA